MSDLYRVTILRAVPVTKNGATTERTIIETYDKLPLATAQRYSDKFGADAVTIEPDQKPAPRANYRSADTALEVDATKTRDREAWRRSVRATRKPAAARTVMTFDPAALVNVEMRKLEAAA